MSAESQPEHLDPSELGTKSYWDNCYDRELSNFAENPEDEGTVWFADSGAEEKMVQYLSDLAEEGILQKGDADSGALDDQATSFLDLGTGNGHLLFALREDGFSGYMMGVDYSSPSIKLAAQIESERQKKLQENNNDESSAPVDFQVCDILATEQNINREFDVLLDKGTFDAISLSAETNQDGRRINEHYRTSVLPLIKLGGRFIITSCNWTVEELRSWFEIKDSEDDRLCYENKINYPTFRYQGQEGQTVVTLCFVKQRRES